ncbi:hypothetical protein BDR05DRAFT_841760, partial [Suillus weaverae]
HPYWYARVIKVFHINVECHENNSVLYSCPMQIKFIFVWWFRQDGSRAGWAAKCLHRLKFFDSEDGTGDAYGFLDPDNVIHGVHLILGFAY